MEVFTDQDVTKEILDVFENARSEVVAVTPYLNLSEGAITAIQSARRRNVQVTFVIRKQKHKPDLRASLNVLRNNNVEVWELNRLHAKIYYNDSAVLLTSMNLLKSSMDKGREVACTLSDNASKLQVRNYVQGLIEEARVRQRASNPVATRAASFLSRVVTALRSRTYEQGGAVLAGFCISCCADIVLDRRFPLCAEHSALWQKRFSGNYCLMCGESAKTTKAKPLCDSCYAHYGA